MGHLLKVALGLAIPSCFAFSSAMAVPASAATAGAGGDLVKRQTPAPLNETGTSSNVLRRNCAYFGWYLDDGNPRYGSQGTAQSLEDINTAVGTPAYSWGAYDHIEADDYVPGDTSTYYNGSEILPYLQPAINANGTIFVASIAPIHGYDGFTANDTNQLDAMISVVKQFVDGGVTVWLRWGHEFNWYYTRGSDDLDPTGRRSYYDSNPQHFIDSWRVVYTKFKTEVPTVQHMWCANVGGMDQLWQFWPGPDYVDIVALDYYTELNAPRSQYLYPDGLIKQTHDTFALAFDKPFWMGETGTRTNSTVSNIQWVETMTSASTCSSMAKYEGMMYFNYKKNLINHYIAVPGGSAVTTAFAQLFGSTPGTTSTSLQSGDSDAEDQADMAFNINHLKFGLEDYDWHGR